MYTFNNENLDQIEKFNGKKVVIELEFMDGDCIMAYGVINASETLINFTHQSNSMPTFNDLMSDFHIQIFKPSPFLTLLNITRFENGNEVGSDQTGLNDFNIIDPLTIYDEFPYEMIQNIKIDEGKTVVIRPISKNGFPSPPFNNHTDNLLNNNTIYKAKTLNGFLKVSNKEIVIDNQFKEHFPEWDLGYEPESNYFAILRYRKGYTIEFIDKSTNEIVEINIDSFQFIGQNSI